MPLVENEYNELRLVGLGRDRQQSPCRYCQQIPKSIRWEAVKDLSFETIKHLRLVLRGTVNFVSRESQCFPRRSRGKH